MFSGWVAMVDRNRSKIFNNLVENYKEILPHLPWGKQLEKDKFLALFLSLNVLTYAGDRHPSGINIPNYNDVRENDGFKNVIFEDGSQPVMNNQERFQLYNYSNYLRPNVKNQEMSDIISLYEEEASMTQTAGHELFGHGSGRLIYRNETTKKCPLSIPDPLNPGKNVSTCYD